MWMNVGDCVYCHKAACHEKLPDYFSSFFPVCVCVCVWTWWGFRTLRFVLQRAAPPPPPPPPTEGCLRRKLSSSDKNKGWDSRGRSSVSDAQSQALRPFCTCFLILSFGGLFRGKAHQRAMLSVKSARQLCKMFFSLHVVFLSVAIVESSASNGNQEGNMIHWGLYIWYLINECVVKPVYNVARFTSNYMHHNIIFPPFFSTAESLMCAHMLWCCFQTAWDPVVWSTEGNNRAPPQVWPV